MSKQEIEKASEEIHRKILKAITQIKIYECTMCGAYLAEEEYKQFEGVCKKHWDY